MSKLDERRKEYGIPEAPCLPLGKKVIVYRLPLEDEKKTAGGLIIPQTAVDPEPTGVLIAAGLKARDVMAAALIEIGDIVWLPRFTTNSPKVEREAGKSAKHVELLNIEDIVGSVDAQARLEKDYEIEYDEATEQHRYVSKGLARKRKAS